MYTEQTDMLALFVTIAVGTDSPPANGLTLLAGLNKLAPLAGDSRQIEGGGTEPCR